MPKPGRYRIKQSLRARLATAGHDCVAPDGVVLVLGKVLVGVVAPVQTVVGLLTRVRARADVAVREARLESTTRLTD